MLKEIKEYDGSVRVIMVTGLVTMGILNQAARLGAEDFVFKPSMIYGFFVKRLIVHMSLSSVVRSHSTSGSSERSWSQTLPNDSSLAQLDRKHHRTLNSYSKVGSS